MSELAYLGLREAAELIRARKLSPVEYTQALLERTEKLDPRYHAYIKPHARAGDGGRAPGRARGHGRQRGAGPCTACRTRSRTSSMSRGCRPPATPRF